ncbi:MAG: hypothetical protein U0401_13105 [Anaerolineae bacterium]
MCQQARKYYAQLQLQQRHFRLDAFLEEGSADFAVLKRRGRVPRPAVPAGYIVTQSHFVGGIYQQVKVTPGNT